MEKRELLALMSAIIYAGEAAGREGQTLYPPACVKTAQALLDAVDASFREVLPAEATSAVAGEDGGE